MKVHADQQICIGSGLCALRLPEIFDQASNDGRVIILRTEPDPTQKTAVLQAIETCPSGALRIDD